MNQESFLRALMPIWLIELILTFLYTAFGPEQITFIGIALLVISAVVLPFFAGLRVIQAGGSLGTAVLGSISISGVTLIVVGLSDFLHGESWAPFGGFIIATLIFAVVPQVIFGVIGGFFGRKHHVST